MTRRSSRSPGTNPFQIGSLGPSFRQDRPQAWAVDGARTYFGTVPTYGTLGGALGWIDSPTSTPVSLRSPVPKESVVSIDGAGGVAFVGTSRWGGLGLDPRRGTGDRIRVRHHGAKGDLECPPRSGRPIDWLSFSSARPASCGACQVGRFFSLDPATGSLIRQLHLTTEAQPDTVTWSVAQLVEVDGLLLVASRGSLQAVDTDALTVTTIQAWRRGPEPGGGHERRRVLPDGVQALSAPPWSGTAEALGPISKVDAMATPLRLGILGAVSAGTWLRSTPSAWSPYTLRDSRSSARPPLRLHYRWR